MVMLGSMKNRCVGQGLVECHIELLDVPTKIYEASEELGQVRVVVSSNDREK